MRVEDLDAGRVRAELEAQQLADLAAIGLDWDGPVVRQSERAELLRGRARAARRRRAAVPLLVHACGDPRGGLRRRTGRCRRAPTPGPAAS